jgi:hypothetical protein
MRARDDREPDERRIDSLITDEDNFASECPSSNESGNREEDERRHENCNRSVVCAARYLG